jgi:uncharacterized damage-inducible protein DinB
MVDLPAHLTGYRREVLLELEHAAAQLLALARAAPAEDYGWAPAEDARTFAAVLVHVATGNLLLLARTGALPPDVIDLYGEIEGEPLPRLFAMIRKNRALEREITSKAAILDLLERSFATVKNCWTSATEEQLWATVDLLGELETVRRLYLRMLAHAHEHMGQAIAYVRAMGYQVPWPDPLRKVEEIEAALAVH